MEMTPNERLMASIRGEEVDHIPFSPFLAYYFQFLPQDVQDKGELPYLQAMGADPLLRGGVCAYDVHSKDCTVRVEGTENKRYATISTPCGELYEEYTYVKQSNTWFMTKHPITDAEQIPAAIAYYQDLVIEEKIAEANEAVHRLGQDGLYLAIVGSNYKSAYQHLLEHLAGTENLIYLTMDDPDKLEELLDVMYRKNLETIRITAKSDVQACISWEDSSTTNVNPSLYSTYIQPEITEWCRVLKEAGKPYIQHACGHIKDLAPLMAEEGVAAIESISPIPTGNIIMSDLFRTLPENVSLIGGIEPTQILNSPLPDLLEYSDMLLQTHGKRGFVLANSDSCPPGVEYEKFTALAQLVKNR